VPEKSEPISPAASNGISFQWSDIPFCWQAFLQAMVGLPKWERVVHIFWLLGPFILLIERTPADIWLSLIALTFAARAILRREGWWLRSIWVRFAFLFWGVCLLAAATSPLPAYSIGETIAWFRFPLFVMAVAFWLGCDRRFVYAMLISLGIAMGVMGMILIAEIAIVGIVNDRLTWPYGDKVPGNYLAKVSLPTFVVLVSFLAAAKSRLALFSAVIVTFTMITSMMTGERINFLIRICSAALAILVSYPKRGRLLFFGSMLFVPIALIIWGKRSLASRLLETFFNELPIFVDSPYFRVMAPGWLAWERSPWLGVGPGNLRNICQQITGNSPLYDCHTHPHNFYLQLLGEAGLIGFVFGVLFLGSIIWACARPAIRDRSNVVVATMWIVPFAFFWPIASTADFFGQWNNIFMWSAVAVALAGAQIGSSDQQPAPR